MSNFRVVTSQTEYDAKHRSNRAIGFSITIAAAVFIMLSISIAVARHFDSAKADPGVQACQKLADNINHPKDSSKGSWTEDDYHKNRKPFEDTKYDDLKAAGTTIVDTIYGMSKHDDSNDTFNDSLNTISTIHTQWSALQLACAKAGVDVPALP